MAACAALLVAGLAGCSSPARLDHAPEPATRSGERWAGLFTPYPGARMLCQQHVSGAAGAKPMHITWTAYATTDEPGRVSEFYARNTGGARVQKSTHGLTQLSGARREILSVMVAARKGYPTCEVKPAATDRTVIIVSRATP